MSNEKGPGGRFCFRRLLRLACLMRATSVSVTTRFVATIAKARVLRPPQTHGPGELGKGLSDGCPGNVDETWGKLEACPTAAPREAPR